MKVKFNIPVEIQGIDGVSRQLCKPGTHELTKEQLSHWFVQGLIQGGQALCVEDVVDVKKNAYKHLGEIPTPIVKEVVAEVQEAPVVEEVEEEPVKEDVAETPQNVTVKKRTKTKKL